MTPVRAIASVAFVNEPSARVWKKIGCFYALTMLFSGVFNAFVLHAGKMDAGNLLYVTGAMWSPALAAFTTKRLFGESGGLVITAVIAAFICWRKRGELPLRSSPAGAT